MWKQGLIFNSLCKWWMQPCHEHWPNELRRSWSRSNIRSQRVLFHCQTWLPWLLQGVWLQAGTTMRIMKQRMGILQDKDPSSIHLHSKPAGLCHWCRLEEGWPHGLVWSWCSKSDLSTDNSSLKDACWIFCVCTILILKLSPQFCLPYRLLFKLVKLQNCNFSFERYFKNLFIFLHCG